MHSFIAFKLIINTTRCKRIAVSFFSNRSFASAQKAAFPPLTTQTNQTNEHQAVKWPQFQLTSYPHLSLVIPNFLNGFSNLFHHRREAKKLKNEAAQPNKLSRKQLNLINTNDSDIYKAFLPVILFTPPLVGYLVPFIVLYIPRYLPSTFISPAVLHDLMQEDEEIIKNLPQFSPSQINHAIYGDKAPFSQDLQSLLAHTHKYSIINRLMSESALNKRWAKHSQFIRTEDELIRAENKKKFDDIYVLENLSVEELIDLTVQRGLWRDYLNSWQYFDHSALQNNPWRVLSWRDKENKKVFELDELARFNYNLNGFPFRKLLCKLLTDWLNRSGKMG
jgi:hypothetical protein